MKAQQEPIEPQEPTEFLGAYELLIFPAETPPAEQRPVLISDGSRMLMGWYSPNAQMFFSNNNVPVSCVAWADIPLVTEFCHDVFDAKRRKLP
jgi:hypothetical protein